MAGAEVLERLFEVIEARRRERPPGSYVVELLAGGLPAIAAKLREESEALIDAAVRGDAAHTAHEAADLLFHTLVLLACAEVAPARAYAVLEQRFGIGGLVEKSSRGGRSDAG